MLFFNHSRMNIDESISLYEKHITENHSHINEVCDIIINVATEIKSHLENLGYRPYQVYAEFYKLVSLFHNGKLDELQYFWIGNWNTYLSDEIKIIKIYEELFKYLGFQTGDDVEYDYNNEILWKIQKEFDFVRKSNFVDNRLDFFLMVESGRSITSESPASFFCCDIKDYLKTESSFRISHHFKMGECKMLCCNSEITFYYPKNSGVTREFTMFYNCKCNLRNFLNYTKKENIEISKWILRKTSYLRFLEFIDQCKQDRLGFFERYVDTYWIDIYKDHKRNKIKLG